MTLSIYVDSYSGHKANERPLRFTLDEETYEIATVEVRWYEADAEYFRVYTRDGKRYVLRHDQRQDEWTLQSGFDGDALFARLGIEVVTVDAAQVHEAEGKIEGCEHCHPDDSEIPLDWILQEVTGKGGMVDFLMLETAKCPNCNQTLTEKTSIEPR